MRFPRLFLLVVGIALILGLVIWLVSALTQLSWQLGYSALGHAVIALILVLLTVLIAALVYYLFWVPRSSRSVKRPPQVSPIKTEAAVENLQAVQQQVSQIQDEVVRRELLQRSREIQQNLARGEVKVVVFGTGSSGKTSLVNALLGQMVGQVGAPMGTTSLEKTYRLRLKGVDREILVTDTPGILEPGVAGTDRERLARRLAVSADLLLFVLDNDLRQAEYEPLQQLAAMGKRSLVVLNKQDLYLDSDLAAIQAQLRSRVQGIVNPEDVIAIAANPLQISLEGEAAWQPEPEIQPLIRRLAAVLRAEGDDLLADNILLQSQRLGEETRQVLDQQRQRQAEKIVDRFQWIGAGVIAVTPLPGVDLLATAAVNAQMVVELGKVYGCEMTLERGRELALSLAKTLVGLGVVRGAIELVSAGLQLSVGGFLVGRGIQGVSAAYLTRIAGRSFIEYFRQDQDWGDGGMTAVVQQQFQLNRRDEFMKAFVQEAVTRVVQPLELMNPHPVAETVDMNLATDLATDSTTVDESVAAQPPWHLPLKPMQMPEPIEAPIEAPIVPREDKFREDTLEDWQ